MDKIFFFAVVLYIIISTIGSAIAKSARKPPKRPPGRGMPDIPPPSSKGSPVRKTRMMYEEAKRQARQPGTDLDLSRGKQRKAEGIKPSYDRFGRPSVLTDQQSAPTAELATALDQLVARSLAQRTRKDVSQSKTVPEKKTKATPEPKKKEDVPPPPTRPVVKKSNLFSGQKSLTSWQQAVILNEILQPPKALRTSDDQDRF